MINPKQISMKFLAEQIEKRINYKKDLLMILTGSRGDGKSTFAYKLANEIKLEFKPKKDIIYDIKELLKWYGEHKKRVVIFDEAIAAHNRSFFEKNQRELVKMLNMYRDSCNVLLMCVPLFSTLDSQLRNLASMRVHIIKRKAGVLHLAKQGQFTKDPWDFELNNKIEGECYKKFRTVDWLKPTTATAIIPFGKLHKRQQMIYDKLKEEKRNPIFNQISPEEETPTDRLHKLLNDGKLSKQEFETSCRVLGVRPDTMKARIRTKVQQRGEKILFKQLLLEGNENIYKKEIESPQTLKIPVH